MIFRFRFGKQLLIPVFLTLFSTMLAGTPPEHIHRTHLLALRITPKEYTALRKLDIEFVTGRTDSITLALASDAELALLRERNYHVSVLMESPEEVQLYKRALYGPEMRLDPVYHTNAEILHSLQSTAEKFPEITEIRTIGRTSQENRPIHAIKISDNAPVEEDEPAILFSGGIHSDELPGIEICMALIDSLTSGYSTDSRIRHWVNSNEIWILPVVNADGHEVVTGSIDPRWRKNIRDLNGNGILYEYEHDGIDLNRNFNFNWAHGGSGDSTNQRYRGPYPFSEGAARALKSLAKSQRFGASITYHSQGEVLYYPWVWGDQHAPDDQVLSRIASGIAAQITTMDGDTIYIPHYGAGRVGQTYPWLYGRLGTFDFIVETGKNRHIFPPDALHNIIRSNIPGAWYLLTQMDGPGLTGHVKDAATGAPLRAQIVLPDIDNEMITPRESEPQYGRFYRLLNPGKYRVIVRKAGYLPEVIPAAVVQDSGWTSLDISLGPTAE